MEEQKILLFDGAYGTYYSNPDVPFCELANLSDPQGILTIHREYIEAGARAVKTNTYNMGHHWITLGEKLARQMISAGVQIANHAVKDLTEPVRVFADLGPLERSGEEPNLKMYQKICLHFLELGVRDFLFETHADDGIFLKLLPWIKDQADVTAITSFAVDPLGYTRSGRYFRDLFDRLSGVSDIVGLNCLCGPAHLLKLIREAKFGGALSVMPNAGYPTQMDGRMVYNNNPEYFAEKTGQMREHGAVVLGGCCGTTPEHIRVLAEMLAGKQPEPVRKRKARIEPPLCKAQKSSFAQKLLSGKKAIACELHSPADMLVRPLIKKASILREAGADIITVADSPLARARADSFMMAAKVKREAGIEAMPHLTCRDRNTIAVRGALLGGYLEGLRDLLVITGDPISSSQEGKEKGVFHANSFELIRYASSLNDQLFQQMPYFIGCGVNPNACRFDVELDRLRKKAKNGAKFCLTQPVYTQRAADCIRRIREETGLFVLMGVMPVASYKNAVFLNNEVPGIELPKELVAAYRDKSREEAEEISVRFCYRMIEELFDTVNGFYMMCPLNRTEVVERLIEKVYEKEQSRRKKR